MNRRAAGTSLFPAAARQPDIARLVGFDLGPADLKSLDPPLLIAHGHEKTGMPVVDIELPALLALLLIKAGNAGQIPAPKCFFYFMDRRGRGKRLVPISLDRLLIQAAGGEVP